MPVPFGRLQTRKKKSFGSARMEWKTTVITHYPTALDANNTGSQDPTLPATREPVPRGEFDEGCLLARSGSRSRRSVEALEGVLDMDEEWKIVATRGTIPGGMIHGSCILLLTLTPVAPEMSSLQS